ncbi:MAG: hypothetical protein AB7V19_01815 [Candidatus Bipolaricaulia bacterium]
MSRRQKRSYVRRDGGKHRVLPVWKQSFDVQAYARALLLLAMHLDSTKQEPHNKGQKSGDGGGHHE